MKIKLKLPNDASPPYLADLTRLLFENCGTVSQGVSLASYSDSLESLYGLAEVSPTLPISSLYYRQVAVDKLDGMFALLKPSALHAMQGDTRSYCRNDHRLPCYDWPEKDSGRSVISLWTKSLIGEKSFRDALDPENDIYTIAQDSMAQFISPGENPRVHHCGTNEDDTTIIHMYSSYISRASIVDATGCLLKHLGLRDISLTVRLERTPAQSIPEEYGNLITDVSNVELGCHLLIGLNSKYSICPDNCFMPVPNVSMVQINEVFSAILYARKDLEYTYLKKNYVPWKSESGILSARTQGNSFEFLITKKKISLEIGIEQYVEKDPPTKQFKITLVKALKRFGLEV